jgi:glucokinase
VRVLAGDIGGTHARLAVVDLAGGVRIEAERTVPTREVSDLATLIQQFLSGTGPRPTRACLGIAGPVREGRVTGTNLPWSLDARELGAALGIPAFRLINDFAAACYGVLRLPASDFLMLQAGEPDPSGAIALIGAGTGLGEGFLVQTGEGWSVNASEGGHVTFASESERSQKLFSFLAGRYGHVSWERVVSGPGLVDCFEFLAQEQPDAVAAALREELRRENPAAAISRHALAGDDPLAREALDLFLDAYGARAGDLALTLLATGGVYLAGGIARHVAPRLVEGGFIAAFLRKGRMRALLERVPVRVILNSDVGLIGAALAAAR